LDGYGGDGFPLDMERIMAQRYDPTTGEPWPPEDQPKMWMKSFSVMEEDKPHVLWMVCRCDGKPYCSKYTMKEDESPYVFEDVEDARARCWDDCWRQVMEDMG